MKMEMPLQEEVKMPTLQTISWQEIQIEEMIGYGGFGEVYRATWSGIKVAVKQLYLKTLSNDLKTSFDQETKLMAHCHFSNIIRLLGVCSEPGRFAMIMEYMPNGSLYSVLQNQTITLPWIPLRWQIAIDVGQGLAYLHSQNIIHHDLKSLNVLLDANYRAKISDFGLSKVKLETTSTTSHSSKKVVGSVRWRAPELFKRKASPTFSSDIYSCGVILWEIATRKLPFADAIDEVTVISWVTGGTKEDIPKDCSENYSHVIEQCWIDSSKRPMAQSLVDDLQKSFSVLQSISETEKSWHFDITTKPISIPQNASYVLIDASPKDIAKVATYYWHHPVPGMDLKRVQVIYNPTMNRGFELRMHTLENRHKQSAFDPKWQYENEKEWREKVNQLALSMSKPYIDIAYPHVKLLPLWHGTKPEILSSIFETGFANLATTDSGFFGKGIYFSYEAEYAYRVYSKGALLLNWVCFYSSYPTVHGDMNKLQGGPNYQNYDAHFVPVIPPGGKISYQESVYYPCKPNQPHQYIEVVVFESQCLPRYLVELQPTLPKSLLSTFQNVESQNTLLSVDWLEKEAQKGDINAEYHLGVCYYSGRGVDQDHSKAVGYYQKAADQGHKEAQSILANCYEEGIGIDKNLQKAAEYYERAADRDQTDAHAQTKLKTFLTKYPELKRTSNQSFSSTINQQGEEFYREGMKHFMMSQYNKALPCFEEAAKQSYPPAYLWLCRLYSAEEYRIPDKVKYKTWKEKVSKSISWFFETEAKTHNADVQYSLGYCYANSIGVKYDIKKAFEYFQKAADQGDARAQFELGFCYKQGKGVEKDLRKVIEYYQKAADQGYAKALCHFGLCYEDGEGVTKDLEKAFEYYQKAADQGDSHGQALLGKCYNDGKGVIQDLKKAVKYYQEAADQGLSAAQYNLGTCYEEGKGVEKNLKKAVEYYRAAANQDHSMALSSLGTCYADGSGVPKDLKKAFECYQKAANLEDPTAQYYLAHYYDNGIYVVQNENKALEYYRKAANQGLSQAQYYMATYYERAKGDMKTAIYYYQKVADKGDEDGQRAVKRLLAEYPYLKSLLAQNSNTFFASSGEKPKENLSESKQQNCAIS